MMYRRCLWVIFLAAFASEVGPVRGQELPVDLELILAVDCSYSVDAAEFRLQLDGLAEAFRRPETIEAILGGPEQRIAVTVIEWSGANSQVTVVPWTLIGDRGQAEALARRIEQAPRLTADGATSISGAILNGIERFKNNGYSALRRVIDVSTDGRNNTGPVMPIARAAANRAGVTVNGLTILTEHPTLHFYFEQRVIVGPGAFVEIANDYRAYNEAIQRKLLREIEAMQFAER